MPPHRTPAMQNRLDLSDRRCTDRNIEIELVAANLILAYFPENVNEYNSLLYLQMAGQKEIVGSQPWI